MRLVVRWLPGFVWVQLAITRRWRLGSWWAVRGIARAHQVGPLWICTMRRSVDAP